MLKKTKKGLTLIEVLVSMVLITIVFSVIVTVSNTGNRLYSKGVKELDNQSNCKKAQSLIRSDLRMGSQVFTDRAHLKDVLGLTDDQYDSLSYTPLMYVHLRNPLNSGLPDQIDGYLYKLQSGKLTRVNFKETKELTNFSDYKFYTDDTKQSVGSYSGGDDFRSWLTRKIISIAFGVDIDNPLESAQYQLPDSVCSNIKIVLDDSENMNLQGYYYSYDSSLGRTEALKRIQEYRLEGVKLAALASYKNTSDKYVILLREAEDPKYKIDYAASNEKTIISNVKIEVNNANMGNAISVSISGYNGGEAHYDEIMSVGLE